MKATEKLKKIKELSAAIDSCVYDDIPIEFKNKVGKTEFDKIKEFLRSVDLKSIKNKGDVVEFARKSKVNSILKDSRSIAIKIQSEGPSYLIVETKSKIAGGGKIGVKQEDKGGSKKGKPCWFFRCATGEGEKISIYEGYSLKLLNASVLNIKNLGEELKVKGRIWGGMDLTIYQNGTARYWEMRGQNLREYMKNNNVDWKTRLAIMEDICFQINTLHKDGKIHSDIKPENILIINGKAMLNDFGAVTNINENAIEYTKDYMPKSNILNTALLKNDIFAFAKSIHECIFTDEYIKGLSGIEKIIANNIKYCINEICKDKDYSPVDAVGRYKVPETIADLKNKLNIPENKMLGMGLPQEYKSAKLFAEIANRRSFMKSEDIESKIKEVQNTIKLINKDLDYDPRVISYQMYLLTLKLLYDIKVSENNKKLKALNISKEELDDIISSPNTIVNRLIKMSIGEELIASNKLINNIKYLLSLEEIKQISQVSEDKFIFYNNLKGGVDGIKQYLAENSQKKDNGFEQFIIDNISQYLNQVGGEEINDNGVIIMIKELLMYKDFQNKLNKKFNTANCGGKIKKELEQINKIIFPWYRGRVWSWLEKILDKVNGNTDKRVEFYLTSTKYSTDYKVKAAGKNDHFLSYKEPSANTVKAPDRKYFTASKLKSFSRDDEKTLSKK